MPDDKHPWGEVVAAAVRLCDAGGANEDLLRAVRDMQAKAYPGLIVFGPKPKEAAPMPSAADVPSEAFRDALKRIAFAQEGDIQCSWCNDRHLKANEHEDDCPVTIARDALRGTATPSSSVALDLDAIEELANGPRLYKVEGELADYVRPLIAEVRRLRAGQFTRATDGQRTEDTELERLRTENAQLRQVVAKAASGLMLKGWWCVCDIFNGEEKEPRTECRSCGQEKTVRGSRQQSP